MNQFRTVLSTTSGANSRLAEEIELYIESPLLDPIWYRETYPDLRDTPTDFARHYLEHGAAEGRNPSSRFDTKSYLAANPDVAASGANPLVHYILSGEREGRALGTAIATKRGERELCAGSSSSPVDPPTDPRAFGFSEDIELSANEDAARGSSISSQATSVLEWKARVEQLGFF